MARFLGRVRGSRGPAQRLGGAGGLTVIAASWSGAVEVNLFDKDGEDWVRIELRPWQNGAGTNAVLYIGPVKRLHRMGLTDLGKRAHHDTMIAKKRER